VILGFVLKVREEVLEEVRVEAKIIIKKTDPGIFRFVNTLINCSGKAGIF